jgi:hypothetical protein
VERHPNTSLHLTARTGGAFPKAVGAAGELDVIDIYSPTKLKLSIVIKIFDIINPNPLDSDVGIYYKSGHLTASKSA